MLSFSLTRKEMKKTLIALAALLLCSCGNKEEKISQAAYGYLEAMGNYRLEEALPYASQQTAEKTIPFLQTLMPHVDSAYIQANTPATITIKEVQVLTDSTAFVTFHKSTPILQQDDTLRMVKERRHWKAHVEVSMPGFLMKDSIQSPWPDRRTAARTLKRGSLGSLKMQ